MLTKITSKIESYSLSSADTRRLLILILALASFALACSVARRMNLSDLSPFPTNHPVDAHPAKPEFSPSDAENQPNSEKFCRGVTTPFDRPFD